MCRRQRKLKRNYRPKMRKITEIFVPFNRVTVLSDSYGQLQNHVEETTIRRQVKNTSSGLRFANYIIDIIGYQILLSVIGYAYDLIINLTSANYPISRTATFVHTIVIILLYPGYYIFFEFLWQRTPAKFITNSIVIDEFAGKPTLRQVILRSFIRIVPFEPFSYLGNSERGWHDKWSETWVVPVSELQELKKLQQEAI